MGMDLSKIKLLLLALSNDLISHTQLTELVKTSRLIIQAYLINYRSKVLNLIDRNGITIADLAFDCIADAFSRNDESKFYIVRKFISSLNQNISETEPVHLYMAYRAFLIKVTEAQLSKLYSETDPIGAKILRNVKDVVRNSDKFKFLKEVRGQLLVVNENNTNDSRREYPIEKLLAEFTPNVGDVNTKSLLNHLYEILNGQKEYERAILSSDVVRVLKKYYNADVISSQEINENSLASPLYKDGFEDYEVDQVKQKVEKYIKEKILLDYFVKGKLSKEESECIYLTIRDIICDWYYGVETKDSVYSYLKARYSIERDEYLKNYKTKIEYLVKLTRDEFAKYLLKEI